MWIFALLFGTAVAVPQGHQGRHTSQVLEPIIPGKGYIWDDEFIPTVQQNNIWWKPHEEADFEIMRVPPTPHPLEFLPEISELVNNIGNTFGDLGTVAMEDNPEIGLKISKMLSGRNQNAEKMLWEYASQAIRARRRRKRQASGADTLNAVGGVLAGTGKEIGGDVKKLSPGAQDKMKKRFKKGLDKCKADSCKAVKGLLDDED